MAETTFTAASFLHASEETLSFLRSKLPTTLTSPSVGIICGSGLGGLADTIDRQNHPYVEIPYEDIPGFAVSTVQGHAGKLVFGVLGEKGTVVVLMVGRIHFYEGHSIDSITFPARILLLLGITTLVVTNAAGGLNPAYNVGDVVVLNDHINFPGFAGAHPLRGPNLPTFGPRFPALSDAYDLSLRRKLHLAWRSLAGTVSRNRKLHEGVYAFVSGPTFETRAECRALHMLGADLVGMSTVPEICVARHKGVRVLAMSLVTNCAVLEPTPRGDDVLFEGLTEAELRQAVESGKANHEEVLESGREAANDVQKLVVKWVDLLD
ncbi:purine nucleoside phosphorylase-like protein [Peziza echinospora]|nr:purine nucleoside phosphorylase-like protein [Peziza echinospora]